MFDMARLTDPLLITCGGMWVTDEPATWQLQSITTAAAYRCR